MKYLVVLISLLISVNVYSDILRVGVDPNLKPFVYNDIDGLKGFDVDIANELCDEIGRHCEFVQMEWGGLLPALMVGKIDVIISSMSITDERKKAVNFTRPYYKSPSQLIARHSFDGLKDGDSVGVLVGSTDERYAIDKLEPNGILVKSYNNQNEAFLDLSSGRLVAILGPTIELKAGLLDTPHGVGYDLFGEPIDDIEYYGVGIGIAVNKRNRDLVELLNHAILSIYDSGVWQMHSDRYFDINIWVDTHKDE